MKKTILMLLLALSSNAFPMDSQSVVIKYDTAVTQTYPGLGPCEWEYDGKFFLVYHNQVGHFVEPEDVDPLLRDITKEKLVEFLQHGYLFINRMDTGEFTITAKVRGEGGGLILLLLGGIAIYEGGKAVANRLFPYDDPFVPRNPVQNQPRVPSQQERREQIIQNAVRNAPVIASDGKKIVVEPKAGCLLGPGIPLRPIAGIGSGPIVKYPTTMPQAPKSPFDNTPTPTRPAPPAPTPIIPSRPTPPLPPPTAPIQS